MIVDSRGSFYRDRIDAAQADPRRRWTAIRNVLHLTEKRVIRSTEESLQLSHGFSQFFTDKIRRIKDTIKQRLVDCADDPLQSDVRHTADMLGVLHAPTADEVLKMIRSMPAKSSPIDTVPTSVIKTCAETFSTLIARLAVLSFKEGKFPTRFKQAVVTPLLKKKAWTTKFSRIIDLSRT